MRFHQISESECNFEVRLKVPFVLFSFCNFSSSFHHARFRLKSVYSPRDDIFRMISFNAIIDILAKPTQARLVVPTHELDFDRKLQRTYAHACYRLHILAVIA